MSERELLVSKIENGIVIDHIPPGKAFTVLKLLKMDPNARAVIAQNVQSRSMGTKDFIKIEGSYLTSKEIDVIAFVAPSATLNIIRDWDIREKRRIEIPVQVEGIFKCPNPQCITNKKYSTKKTQFNVETGSTLEDTRLHCNYCGSVTYYGTLENYLEREELILEGGGLVSQAKIERVFLDVLIKGGALRFPPSPDEPFILKSGRPSPYFVNLGALTDGESLAKLKWAFASFIALKMEQGALPEFDYIFGPSYKGIGLAALACEGLNELYGMDKRFMYDRKEAKDYGDLSADRVLVGSGYFQPGQRILIVDDTITTGITKKETIDKLRMLGEHEVVGMVIAVDRQEKMGDTEAVEEKSASESIEEDLGIKMFSIQDIHTIYDLIKDNLDPELRRLWIDYYDKYGTVRLE